MLAFLGDTLFNDNTLKNKRERERKACDLPLNWWKKSSVTVAVKKELPVVLDGYATTANLIEKSLPFLDSMRIERKLSVIDK